MSSSPFGFPPSAHPLLASFAFRHRGKNCLFGVYPSTRLYLFLSTLSPFHPPLFLPFSLLSCPMFSDLFLSPVSSVASKFRFLSISFKRAHLYYIRLSSILLKSPLDLFFLVWSPFSPVPLPLLSFSLFRLFSLTLSPMRNNKRSTKGETTPRPSVIAPIFAQEVRRQFGRTAHHRPGKVRPDNERPCGR